MLSLDLVCIWKGNEGDVVKQRFVSSVTVPGKNMQQVSTPQDHVQGHQGQGAWELQVDLARITCLGWRREGSRGI